MDRAWTGAFFLWSAAGPQSAQRVTFTRTFTGFAEIARATEPSRYIGQGWRTSRTKGPPLNYAGLSETDAYRVWYGDG